MVGEEQGGWLAPGFMCARVVLADGYLGELRVARLGKVCELIDGRRGCETRSEGSGPEIDIYSAQEADATMPRVHHLRQEALSCGRGGRGV